MAEPSASIVLVEDSLPYARLVSLLLADAVPGGIEVRHHERLAAAVDDLRARDADAVLLDLSLPDASGLEGLATLTDAGVTCPVLVLSGHDDDALALDAIGAGAQDYLVKGNAASVPAFVRAIRFAVARRRAQERTEDLLRAREDRWRTLTHLAPVGIMEIDDRGRCVFANDWVCELTGFRGPALLDQGWREAVHPADRATLETSWRAAAAGDGEFSMEMRFAAPDGTVRWAHATGVLLRDPWGSAAGWLGTLIDVSAQRRAREELHEAEQALRRQQADVLALSALARDASTAQDPVPALCAGACEVLGAEDAELLTGDEGDAGAEACELRRPVVRGGEHLGVLRVRWPGGAPAPGAREETLVELVAAELGAAVQRRRLLDQLRDLARTDPLTGLANRRLWDDRLGVELARADRSGLPLCVAALDLDRFKPYNDHHGHQAGDRLLVELAEGWRALLRGADLLARLGGDEFAVLLPDCDLGCAEGIVIRLQEATPGEIACSAGLVVRTAGEPADALLARADAALYAAKADGLGGVRRG
ncbi:diguanylate cyclase [Baekduia soli]|uniref:Diguanylate cyclase n=1 Tax=Baekduia soli TaxID=496014 RepID=A0A5B8U020_9ACTN|nr:diguanylate cyclase [Baekduia soli]QEC46314.1 diguanylate cyclase [Baekduia soli]